MSTISPHGVVSLNIFTSCAVFWGARRASQNTSNEYKYSAILHIKMSNKWFIIQCFHLLAFLIVSVVKSLKILKKSLFSTRAHTSTLTGFAKLFQFVARSLCRKLLTKNGKNLSILFTYNSLKYWETIKSIELNLHLHNYSILALTWPSMINKIKQDYTRLASAGSKIICCKQTSICTPKTAITYLHILISFL